MKSWREDPAYQTGNPTSNPTANPTAAPPGERPGPDAKLMALQAGLVKTVQGSGADDDDKAGALDWLERYRRAIVTGQGKDWGRANSYPMRQALARCGYVLAKADEPLDGELLDRVAREVFKDITREIKAPEERKAPARPQAPAPKQESITL